MVCYLQGNKIIFLYLRLCILLGFSLDKIKVIVLLYFVNPGTIFNISIYSENIYFMIHLVFLTYMLLNKDIDIAVKDQTKIKILGNFIYLFNLIKK